MNMAFFLSTNVSCPGLLCEDLAFDLLGGGLMLNHHSTKYCLDCSLARRDIAFANTKYRWIIAGVHGTLPYTVLKGKDTEESRYSTDFNSRIWKVPPISAIRHTTSSTPCTTQVNQTRSAYKLLLRHDHDRPSP